MDLVLLLEIQPVAVPEQVSVMLVEPQFTVGAAPKLMPSILTLAPATPPWGWMRVMTAPSGVSSLVMVPVPVLVPRVALTTLLRTTVKVSSSSGAVSPQTLREID